MRRIPLRRPSPALAVALLALFVASGGTAVATTKLIDGSDVARNSLPGDRIKPGSVGPERIKPESLTGAQIQEWTLGNVRRSITADHAGYADRAGHADSTSSVDSLHPLALKHVSPTAGTDADAGLAAAPPITLAKRGPLTIYGKCVLDTTNDQVFAFVLARSTQDGAIAVGDAGAYTGDDQLLTNSGTTERQRTLELALADPNVGRLASWSNPDVQLLAPDGTQLGGQFYAGAKHGTIPGSTQGVWGNGDGCIFWGTVIG
jgi:hypothetical protein